MTHPIYRITSIERVPPYSLLLRFNDGLTRMIDFEPILEGELYGPLRDPLVFAQVTLDPEVHTVIWPCGADFDPATLHDWPEHEAAFLTAAKRWSNSHANAGKPRQLGLLHGMVTESPDCEEPDADLAASINAPLHANLAPLSSSNVAEEHLP
jgi:hypothetical protein